MSRIAQMGIACILAAIVLAAVPIAAAQQPINAEPAPIPIQILAGKKLFISNGDGDEIFNVPNLTYNTFYAAMKSWGRFELVSAPADADLVFEVRFSVAPFPCLRLVILDPKTHVTLWHMIESVQGWTRESTGRKNFDKGIITLVEEVKMLTSHDLPATNAAAPNK
jgi:hypothetical protein